MSNRPKIASEVRSITPAMANRFMADSPINRPLIASAVDRIVKAMDDGDWVVADPIIFDENGLLMDGHHRMAGLIKHGKPVRFLVISGVSREDYWGRGNQGRPRTAGHALAEKRVQNWSTVASTAHRILCWESGCRPPVPQKLASGRRFNNFEIARRALEEPFIVQLVNETPKCRGLLPGGTQGFLCWLFSQTDATHAKCFFGDLATGESLPGNDPVLVLRNKIISARLETQRKRGRTDEGLLMAWVIRAWNASIQGADISLGSLRWNRGTAFPEPGKPRKRR